MELGHLASSLGRVRPLSYLAARTGALMDRGKRAPRATNGKKERRGEAPAASYVGTVMDSCAFAFFSRAGQLSARPTAGRVVYSVRLACAEYDNDFAISIFPRPRSSVTRERGEKFAYLSGRRRNEGNLGIDPRGA